MVEVKTVAQEYSRSHKIYRHGESSEHFMRIEMDTNEPYCICGWRGMAQENSEHATVTWRRHVPTAQ